MGRFSLSYEKICCRINEMIPMFIIKSIFIKMICLVIRDCLHYYILHIIRMNYNDRYANYECDNLKIFITRNV